MSARRVVAGALVAAAGLGVLVVVRPDLALTGWVLVPVLLLATVAIGVALRSEP